MVPFSIIMGLRDFDDVMTKFMINEALLGVNSDKRHGLEPATWEMATDQCNELAKATQMSRQTDSELQNCGCSADCKKFVRTQFVITNDQ